MRSIISLLAGLMFGLGLLLSGMGNPAKVQNFLDIFGTWDPSLAFVMGGAIAVTAPGFWLVRRLRAPMSAPAFSLPSKTDLDRRLIAGSAVFGIGWGLSGFCPGPVVTAAPMGAPGTFVFLAAMLVGITVGKMASQKRVPVRVVTVTRSA